MQNGRTAIAGALSKRCATKAEILASRNICRDMVEATKARARQAARVEIEKLLGPDQGAG